jgi:hypothetical protein
LKITVYLALVDSATIYGSLSLSFMCRPAIAFLKVKKLKSIIRIHLSIMVKYFKSLQQRRIKATGVQYCRWLQEEIAAGVLRGWDGVVPEDQDFTSVGSRRKFPLEDSGGGL